MALIEPLISPLVRGYTELYNKQKNLKKLQEGKKDEFFGLRDFYRYECVYLSAVFHKNLISNVSVCVITQPSKNGDPHRKRTETPTKLGRARTSH